ncbi:MAG: hypothetical protein LBR85_06080 [Oscillospiraceae bacterium]|jgi:hypothetical protein|nr:hypothetical protein [Oscillospiraceae bacterium]
MGNKIVTEWAREKGLECDGSSALMLAGGYICTYYCPDSNNICVAAAVKQDTWNKEVQAELKKALKKTGAVGCNKGILRVAIPTFPRKAMSQKLDAATQILLAELPRLGVLPVDTCCYCGEGECDDRTRNGDVYCPAHTRCKGQQSEKILAEIEHNQQHGSILLGVVGAILGGLVGCIPSFITAHFLDMISGWLFLLIPVASYFGYKLFKGVMNAAVPIIISIISLLSTFVLVLSYEYTAVYQALSEAYPGFQEELAAEGDSAFGYIFDLMFSEELRGDLFADMIVPFLFCVGGLIGVWGLISKTNKDRRLEAERLASGQ